jgi:hypothetical protein
MVGTPNLVNVAEEVLREINLTGKAKTTKL